MEHSAAHMSGTSDPITRPDTITESPHHRDRRREKQQLSCTFCRRRKIRCDRQLPCKTCVSKGIPLSCAYAPGPQKGDKAAGSVGERIQQLEAMVRSLLEQQQQQQQQLKQTQTPDAPPFKDSPAHYSFQGTPSGSPQSGITPPDLTALVDEDRRQTPASSTTKDNATHAPSPSEYGSMRAHSHGANYVGSVHWAAVLDSISELKDHYEEEEESRMRATSDYVLPRNSPGPRLFYEPVHATKADILASIPARPVVDRMIARYFQAEGAVLGVLHSGQFLREYKSFWQDPDSTSFAWIGLLFSIMCLATQYLLLTNDTGQPNLEIQMRVHTFRERTVHCLVLGQFTRGGTHVLEAMINYLGSELICRDADIGLWLLQGLIVQLALSLGYHRDPQNFSNLSPFAGEMRRRVWMFIAQMDLRLSGQVGLPRLLKLQQCDTAEPRNLLDTDFDEETVELPPSRPETELTPMLYGLAKNRLDSVTNQISDFITDTRDHPYQEVMEFDQKVREVQASLPPIFQWQPLSQSFTIPPQIVAHRIWHKMAVHRLRIWLHRKYLAPSYTQAHYEYSRNACVHAAIKILEFQQLVDEETQPDGQLYLVRWMFSSLLQSVFLLGMSVLCYYLQLAKTTPDVQLDQDLSVRIHDMLRNSYPIWLRSSTVSRGAREAVKYLLCILPELRDQQDVPLAHEAVSRLATSQEFTVPQEQVNRDAYQEYIANFPTAFGDGFMVPDTPGLFPGMSVSVTDPLLMDTAELDQWMAI